MVCARSSWCQTPGLLVCKRKLRTEYKCLSPSVATNVLNPKLTDVETEKGET